VTVGAVLAAGGRGDRLGADVPKALVPLAGEPLVVHACRRLRDGGVAEVVVAAPAEQVARIAALLPDACVVAGGATRTVSVRQALAAMSENVDVVLVHDAARPLAPAALVARVAAAVEAGADAVVPVIAVVDTVKEVDDGGTVRRTLDRASLRAVQTPQGFRREVLMRAHETADDVDASDDAGLVERLGVTVSTVPGSTQALKVTTRSDLLVLEALLQEHMNATGEAK
jgi:2-C-methyl-D-erythritol 4-phosphate cytidylyltransferase